MALDQFSQGVQCSLTALSMIRAGKICNNQDVVQQGRIVYGSALRQIRNDLMKEKFVQLDQTLAACWILAVYEVTHIR